MSAANNKQKKQDITKAAAPAKVVLNTATAPANAGGFDDFQQTVSRKQRVDTQKKGASEEVKKEEAPALVTPSH